MLATINQGVGMVLIGLGIVLLAVGAYLGFFGWLNDGPAAGLELFLTAAAFGLGLVAGGLAFRLASIAHARGHHSRWWIQILAPLAAAVAMTVAAGASAVVDKVFRAR